MQLCGVLDRGTREEDDPETWESPCSPRESGKQDGDPDPNLRRWRVSGRMRQTNKKRARLER